MDVVPVLEPIEARNMQFGHRGVSSLSEAWHVATLLSQASAEPSGQGQNRVFHASIGSKTGTTSISRSHGMVMATLGDRLMQQSNGSFTQAHGAVSDRGLGAVVKFRAKQSTHG